MNTQSVPILNDDCLLRIFFFLDLASLARLAMVSTRFRDLVQYTYKSFRELNVDDLLLNHEPKATDLQRIAMNIGPYVRVLRSLDFYDDNIIDFLPALKFFTNLEGFELIGNFRYVSNANYQNFLAAAFRTVKEVSFEKCDLTDYSVKGIGKAVHLRKVFLESCSIGGTWLGKLRNITTLHFQKYIPPISQFRTFCKHNSNLSELVLHRYDYYEPCGNYLNVVFKYLTNLEMLVLEPNENPIRLKNFKKLFNLPKLEYLKLQNGQNLNFLLEHLANHNTLKILDISLSKDSTEDLRVIKNFRKLNQLNARRTNFDDSLLIELCSSESCETLQSLKIGGTAVTDDEVGEFIIKCKNLEFIDLTECEKITDNLITKIAPELENRPHKLYIQMEGTEIKNQLQNNVIHCSGY
ncbi:hypothetical protein DMENIID0001_159250 [Sergentomyia squamirostris]